MKKVGLVSCMHESNSFNSRLTTLEMFKSGGLLFGDEIIAHWAESQHEIAGMLEMMPKLGVEVIPLVTAWAMPSGPIKECAYEEISNEILSRIQSQSLDGVLLALHGAMVAEHVRDADGLLVERIRETVGAFLPIVMTLDLHANVSPRMIFNATAATIYRTYPHLDQRERGKEAAKILVNTLEAKSHPVQVLEKPPVLINILAQRTDVESMAGVYRKMEETTREPGIISASIALGFPYADVEEMGPSILVIGDGNGRLAGRKARALAKRIWDLRRQWNVVGIPVSKAIEEVVEATRTPVTLLDVGDNVGGGSPGDSTIIFEAIQKAGVTKTLVILYDPEAVRSCVAAGVGETVRLKVGGKTDHQRGRPVPIKGRLRMLHDGLFVETLTRHGGKLWNNQGLTAVVETPEEHTIVLTSLRMAPFSLEQVVSLGIKPECQRVLIAKGAIAPRAAYEPISGRIIEVDSPGITSANLSHFTYRFRRRPMFPFEPETEYYSSE